MQSDEKTCSSCADKTACISFFAHENDMVHKDMDNERAHKTNRNVCITFIVIVIVFVTAYTVRTTKWLDAYTELVKVNQALVEELYELHKQPDSPFN